MMRTRWAAIGAAVAVTIGAGGLMSASATVESGERAVFIPITPCRVMDTRPATTVGPRNTALGPAETYTIQVIGVNGNCTIPADAVGLVTNVTIDQPSAPSFLTVWPADAPRPLASSLNWVANQPPQPNAVTTDISADGKVSFFNNGGTVHVIADIVGYYADHNHDDRYYTKAQSDAMAPVAKAHLNITNAVTGTVEVTGAPNVTATYNNAAGYLEVTLTGQTLTDSTFAIFTSIDRVNASAATQDRMASVFYAGGKAQITVYDVDANAPVAQDVWILIYKL
jgi:hypothetical protein